MDKGNRSDVRSLLVDGIGYDLGACCNGRLGIVRCLERGRMAQQARYRLLSIDSVLILSRHEPRSLFR